MTATIRAKMVVHTVARNADMYGQITSELVTLGAVYGNEGSANAQWSKWTPSGTITMTISNPGAFDKLLPGQFYFIDFVPTDKDG